MTINKPQEFRIYKPRKTNDGAASAWQLRDKKGKYGIDVLLFLTMAKQIEAPDQHGNAKFGWPKKEDTTTRTVAKLEEVDIGEFLAVLNGWKDNVGTGKGLFHQNAKGNTVITFGFMKSQNEGSPPFYILKISAKGKEDKEALQVQHSLTLGEAACLKVLLEKALARKYWW